MHKRICGERHAVDIAAAVTLGWGSEKEQVRKGGLPPLVGQATKLQQVLVPTSGGKPPFLTCSKKMVLRSCSSKPRGDRDFAKLNELRNNIAELRRNCGFDQVCLCASLQCIEAICFVSSCREKDNRCGSIKLTN